MKTHRTVAAWLAAFGAFALAAPTGAQSDYGRSVYGAPPAPTASSPAADMPVTERFFEAEWTEPESIVEIPPGSLNAEDDPLPWRAEEIDGAMDRERFEPIGFGAVAGRDRVGWSSSVDTVALWSDYNDSAAVGARFTVSHESEEGSGFEFRLNTLNADYEDSLNDVTFDQQRIDLDFTQRVSVGASSFTFSAGPRFARFQDRRSARDSSVRGIYGSFYDRDYKFIGGGIGFGVDFERRLYQTEVSEFSLVGHARYSWLYGGLEEDDYEATDTSMWIREVAGGLEWRRQWGEGDLILHSLFEVQEASAGYSPISHGVALRIGYQW